MPAFNLEKTQEDRASHQNTGHYPVLDDTARPKQQAESVSCSQMIQAKPGSFVGEPTALDGFAQQTSVVSPSPATSTPLDNSPTSSETTSPDPTFEYLGIAEHDISLLNHQLAYAKSLQSQMNFNEALKIAIGAMLDSQLYGEEDSGEIQELQADLKSLSKEVIQFVSDIQLLRDARELLGA